MCGIAGSGKTTYAQRLQHAVFKRLSIDEEIWRRFGGMASMTGRRITPGCQSQPSRFDANAEFPITPELFTQYTTGFEGPYKEGEGVVSCGGQPLTTPRLGHFTGRSGLATRTSWTIGSPVFLLPGDRPLARRQKRVRGG
jgi:hypothetical protein